MKFIYLKKIQSAIALLAILLSGQSQGYAQTSYVIESIPYQIYEATAPIEGTFDDNYSDIIEIPFDFTFFGQTYNQFVISGNGFISFNTELANTFSTWQFSNTIL